MYQLSIKPEDLKKAASAANTAKFNSDVETVLRGVERSMQDYVNLSKHSPSKANGDSLRYDDHRMSTAVLAAACQALNVQGFKARIVHDEGYDDGPCSVHSSPPSDYIVIDTK